MSRESLIDDLASIVAEEGTEGLSVRRLAARSGVAIGTVQHYFPTKAQMLIAAMERISRLAEGVSDAVAALEDPYERLRRYVALLLPTTPDQPVGRIWLAFAGRAPFDPVVAERYQAVWGRLHARLAGLVRTCRPDLGQAADDAAAELLALLDGLALAIMAEPNRVSPDAALRIAQRHVDALLVADDQASRPA